MFSNFLIGLREGLEASLVIGILVAYLVKTGRTEHLRAVWVGVVVAIVASVGFVGVLELASRSLSERTEMMFTGTMSVLTVVLLTWMIFWMRRTAHTIKGELHGKMDAAIDVGGFALAVMSTVAVGREGLETAMFLWTNEQAASGAGHPAVGGVLGLLAAAVIGYLIYKRAVNFDLATFFLITGALLIVVAAGVLGYAVHEFQELGWLPGEHSVALDVTSWYSVDSWYGSVAKGLFNFTPELTWLQVTAWFAYLVPVMTLFLRGNRPARTAAPAGASAGASVTAG